MSTIKINNLEEFRRQILLSKSRVDHELELCFNKVWYNLLVSNKDIDWKDNWDHNLSSSCQTKIHNYLNNRRKYNLDNMI